jgi:alanyl-tRNA synthetase
MTSAEIRKSFLDFFAQKQHCIVPSASLLPQSPGLLFTNAGMNQFVPYFLGTEAIPYTPARAADTQKCIRAGGKHNDLDDVGYDTYHHTFFEMLGNWSFGNYFKKEAIEWAWELLVDVWGVPADRLYATVYAPGPEDPSCFDQEAYDHWKILFEKKGLDPQRHIIPGDVKDNFWMMGETGPCGPCSELHVDLTPNGDSAGRLVNQDSDLCIEIWNLVFIQYNAEADGSFIDLPAKHVDTGMGFERVCSLIQNTRGFTDFSQKPTNYSSDVFCKIFSRLEALSELRYHDIYPHTASTASDSDKTRLEQAIAFRVIADHIRTLSFSIADGILPGNTGRNYVLRRILRRAVKYGRALGFAGQSAFLPALVDTVVEQFSEVFPELTQNAKRIKTVLSEEEASFNKTLDRGLQLFESVPKSGNAFPPEEAFKLYDTYGFPIDLTALLCREGGYTLDEAAVEDYLEAARERSRGAQKKSQVKALELKTEAVTQFIGFDQPHCNAKIVEVHQQGNQLLVITDQTVFFTEMGGQAGDIGKLLINGKEFTVDKVITVGTATAHCIDASVPGDWPIGSIVTLKINTDRRKAIEMNHSATHLLHWALHKVVSPATSQQGSSVTTERLRFDFNASALSAQQIDEVEAKVNSCIHNKDTINWAEHPYSEIRHRPDIMQFFGDKYGETVRVVQIGGHNDSLNGYSMELCGGTHVRNTAEIELFKIKSESAIAAGVRRIEALCGQAAKDYLEAEKSKELAARKIALEKLSKINQALIELEAERYSVPEDANAAKIKDCVINADKALKKVQASRASQFAKTLLSEQNLSRSIALATEGPAALINELINHLKQQNYQQHACCIVDDGHQLLIAAYSGNSTEHHAGQTVQALTKAFAGKGGGKANFARGSIPDRKLKDAVLDAANKLIIK